MMPSPVAAEAQRCTTPMTPLSNGTATIANPSNVTLPRSSDGIATSINRLISSGGIADRSVIATMVMSTTAYPRFL